MALPLVGHAERSRGMTAKIRFLNRFGENLTDGIPTLGKWGGLFKVMPSLPTTFGLLLRKEE